MGAQAAEYWQLTFLSLLAIAQVSEGWGVLVCVGLLWLTSPVPPQWPLGGSFCCGGIAAGGQVGQPEGLSAAAMPRGPRTSPARALRICPLPRTWCTAKRQTVWPLALRHAPLAAPPRMQGTCVWGGLVAGCVVCVRGVAGGTLTVGDAVLFVTMMNQLYVPLTYFGSYYRQVSRRFFALPCLEQPSCVGSKTA